jgi:hypothetical protein
MSARPCEVQALGRTWSRRLYDRVTRGHARHVCTREREFMQEHDGDHACRCGLTYAKSPTDNGPAPGAS